MHVWICNSCHAEIENEKEPKNCPLCGQSSKGFDEGERKEQDPEDKKYSKIYKDLIKDLEKYDEGTEPEKLKYCFEE